MNSQEFVSIVNELIDKKQKKGAYKIGKIPDNHTSGDPKILFDGEQTPSGKTYKCLSSYYPIAGDRVLLARVSNTYVVLGGLGNREAKEISFTNGWDHYGSPSSQWGRGQYIRESDGTVRLMGLIKGEATGVIGNLPKECRPKKSQLLTASVNSTFTSNVAPVVARIQVDANGDLRVITKPSGALAWMALDGISYTVK
ncbi:receptor-binding protein [Bacillus phage Novomoskovsk]|uniref:Receptor-binding protein n=1 Tax=Bacillus phage Novomoskovsk TaxID=2736258 RepID=A0A6M9Z5H2_9CAUD|nr:receptor-binding protein [Bacillus phage Novomoskovsk]